MHRRSERDARADGLQALSDAYTNQQIFQFASENWDVGSRMAENYIREAREMLAEDCKITRQAYLAEVLARLRNYEQQASKRGQLQVATNSVRLQAELVGLTFQGIVTTEIENLPCGTVQIKVCQDNICIWGWVSSHHLVPTKESQLQEVLHRELKREAAAA